MRKLTVTIYIVSAQSPGHFHYTTSLNPDEAIEIQHAWKEKGWYALSISSEKHELEISCSICSAQVPCGRFHLEPSKDDSNPDFIPAWKLLEAEEE